jgi:hypothetical protein
VIVRILGDGQYRAPDSLAEQLAAVDRLIDADLLAGDPAAFASHMAALIELVRREGTPLDDGAPAPSDMVIPPPDITLDELRALLAAAPPGGTGGGTGG